MTLLHYLLNRNNYPIKDISHVLVLFNQIVIGQIDNLHTYKTRIDYWQHPIETLYFKFSLHLSSIVKLLNKTSVSYDGKLLDILDISSINILTRAIIENYMMIYYLYFDNIDSCRKEFRFLIYAIDGLSRRQKNLTAFDDELSNQLSNEKKELINLKDKLKNNSYFQSLSLKQQENYLKGCAKEKNLTSLLELIDLNPELYQRSWQLQSNYAHSEFISVLQIRGYVKRPEELNITSFVMAELIAMIAAISIDHLKNNFEAASLIFEELDDEKKKLLDFFLKQGKK